MNRLKKCDICKEWIKGDLFKVHITKNIYVKGELYGEELVEYLEICEKCKDKIMEMVKK